MPFTDKTLICADCGQEFIFSADDQEFYSTRGFSEPKRCRSCRAMRRNERDGGAGGGGGGGGYDSRGPRMERELFDVVCSSCGQPTKVPFQPRGDRPVYCRDCFERVGRPSGGGMSRGGGGGGGGGYGRR
ncbi:MAG TPA: CxxC-x17-CxxC domain-containing protein [Dehalococcoidia bacterium]|nr:CxxC-x17-CxxC domain-containing protein [Dehalococcoidia bacterium]